VAPSSGKASAAPPEKKDRIRAIMAETIQQNARALPPGRSLIGQPTSVSLGSGP
jgi:hypothetical protein